MHTFQYVGIHCRLTELRLKIVICCRWICIENHNPEPDGPRRPQHKIRSVAFVKDIQKPGSGPQWSSKAGVPKDSHRDPFPLQLH